MVKDFVTWANKRIKLLNVWDIQLIKLSSMAFILVIAKLWDPLLSLAWYWYAVICILAALIPLNKVFKK